MNPVRVSGQPVRFSVHPDSKKKFAGLTVPHLEEGQKLALLAHEKSAPAALALGWDVALADTGPVLLEVKIWTACYDYDPETDAFTRPCEAVAALLRSP